MNEDNYSMTGSMASDALTGVNGGASAIMPPELLYDCNMPQQS